MYNFCDFKTLERTNYEEYTIKHVTIYFLAADMTAAASLVNSSQIKKEILYNL